MAGETAAQLRQAFMVGLGDGWPERVPLVNYNGVDLDAPYGSNARGAHDYMRMVRGSFSISRIPDPTDDRWITVVASMRLTWRSPGRRILGKRVESLKTEVVVIERTEHTTEDLLIDFDSAV